MSRSLGALTDQILIGNPSKLSSVLPVTYSAWIKPSAYGNPSNGRIINKADPSTGKGHAFFLSSGAGGQINAQISKSVTDATAVAAWPASLIDLVTWKFVVMTYKVGDGGPRIFFGDFKTQMAEMSYVSRTDGSGTLTDISGFNLLIGASDLAAKNVFQGAIAHVSIMSGAAALTLLDRLRRFPNAPDHQSSSDGVPVLAYYPLADQRDQLTGQALDYSGNGLNATVTGTAKGLRPGLETQGSSGW